MHENHHNNIEILQSVCESLEELVEEVVFVGGSVASTYVDLAHFLASKVEAFYGRGSDDPRFSHDLEDVVLILDGTEDVLDKLNGADPEVFNFLKQTATEFLKNTDIQEAIIGHLDHSAGKVDAINELFKSLK